MMSERKRKWILGTILFVVVVTPIAFFNSYTLDRIQGNIAKNIADKKKFAPGDPEDWMPLWQFRVAEIYRYTFRDEDSDKAFAKYIEYFYLDERKASPGSEAHTRALEAVWDYSQVLEGVQNRPMAYLYYKEIVDNWPDHPNRPQAEARAYQLRKDGYGN